MAELSDWTVGGAVIEGPEGLLLVQNLRANGSLDWTPPGGVIEVRDGESLLDGLTREVVEETGLQVTEWHGPLYRVTTTAPAMGWRMLVEVYLAVSVEGEVRVGEDPDGIVVDAAYVSDDVCRERLVGGHPWVAEPLGDWLEARWRASEETPHYAYEIAGSGLTDAVVARLAP